MACKEWLLGVNLKAEEHRKQIELGKSGNPFLQQTHC